MSSIYRGLHVLPYVVRPEHSEHSVVLSLYNEFMREASAIDKVYRGIYSELDMRQGVMHLQTLTDLGINNTSAIRTKTSSDLTLYGWNMMWVERGVENTYYDHPEVLSAIQATNWGVGARIVIACWDVHASANITSPKGIAASASGNLATTHFDIHLLGADAAMLKILRPILVRSGSKFTMDEFHILEQIEADLMAYFTNEEVQHKLYPGLLSVDVDFHRLRSNRRELANFRSVLASEIYALERGIRKESYHEAINHSHMNPDHWPKADPQEKLIKEVYKEYWHLTEDNHKPDDAALIKRTEHLLSLGRGIGM